jgi:predicted Fe-Mo cluster-binding NifX family protein
MKIAVTAAGPTLDSPGDPRFGRCDYFVIVETADMSAVAVANPNVDRGGGAGIQSAQLMASHGIKAVLTGNCGPNAHQALSAAGIEVVLGCAGSVGELARRHAAGELSGAAGPNVDSHAGLKPRR